MPSMNSAKAKPVTKASMYRSGAVARMLRMPVATLRVWERRYQLTQAALSPSGQRQYSSEDVRRLALIKQLTDLGHAIGSIATLGMEELQRVASTHATVLSGSATGERPAVAPVPPLAWRVVVIGAALGSRMQRPALLRRLARPVELLGPFDSLGEAATALEGKHVDALLVHEPQLLDGWITSLESRAPAFAQTPKAIIYGFAADAACDALATAGVALLREPQPDAVLAQWLNGLARADGPHQKAASQSARVPGDVRPRRWSDAALADFAALSSTIACECPRHVAELLVQLSHFEKYSAECANRNAQDAQLHAYLQQVAAASRASFEDALEYVAMHEGLVLPASHAQLPHPPADSQ